MYDFFEAVALEVDFNFEKFVKYKLIISTIPVI